jgi:hypothetical protein
MEEGFRTAEEFQDIDNARDRFRTAIPDPAERRRRLADHLRRHILPAERALLPLVPADDAAPGGPGPEEALAATADRLTDRLSAGAPLTLEDLCGLSACWNGGHPLRATPAPGFAGGDPAEDPAYLREFLANTLAWLSVESTRLFHPVETYCLLTLRLADLRPFPAWNFPLVRIVPWTHLLAADYPPPLLSPEQGRQWFADVSRARAGHTEALVRLCHAGVGESFRRLFVSLGFEQVF